VLPILHTPNGCGGRTGVAAWTGGRIHVRRACNRSARRGDHIVEADEATIERFAERVDTGEAEALAAAIHFDGVVATDDMAARKLARERDISFTGSVGILADGVHRDELDVKTADRWLSEWVRIAGYHSPIETVGELL
jgi:predicted nucleic acid-binding protein